MSPLLLYSTCVVGAVGLYLILRPGSPSTRIVGTILGLAAMAYLGLRAALAAGVHWQWGGESPVLFGLFSLIALAGAVRMITHPRPVYAALYFIVVVLSSAALFLMLQAEFIAFALVIVYAGAILITYMFVLMLAQQATEENVNASAEYDRVPREPAAAVLVGLVLVAATADVMVGANHRAATDEAGRSASGVRALVDPLTASRNSWAVLDYMTKARDREIMAIAPDMTSVETDDAGRAIRVDSEGRALVTVTLVDGSRQEIELPDSARLGNTESVGIALVARFPVSLELAGVILTMAMFGAVVLARRQVELGEDRQREAVGLARLTVDLPEADDDGGRP